MSALIASILLSFSWSAKVVDFKTDTVFNYHEGAFEAGSWLCDLKPLKEIEDRYGQSQQAELLCTRDNTAIRVDSRLCFKSNGSIPEINVSWEDLNGNIELELHDDIDWFVKVECLK